jgi:hypothetical protein
LEWLYLELGYIIYNHWAIWLSLIFYTVGFSIIAKYASRLMKHDPSPVSFSVIIGTATYSILTWFGVLFTGLFRLYGWHLHLFKSLVGELSFPEVSMGEIFGCVAALLIPKLSQKYRPMVFLVLAIVGTVFYYIGYGKGWLVYRHWNHLISALRWFVPFLLIICFERWESDFLGEKNSKSTFLNL